MGGEHGDEVQNSRQRVQVSKGDSRLRNTVSRAPGRESGVIHSEPEVAFTLIWQPCWKNKCKGNNWEQRACSRETARFNAAYCNTVSTSESHGLFLQNMPHTRHFYHHLSVTIPPTPLPSPPQTHGLYTGTLKGDSDGTDPCRNALMASHQSQPGPQHLPLPRWPQTPTDLPLSPVLSSGLRLSPPITVPSAGPMTPPRSTIPTSYGTVTRSMHKKH